MDTLVLLFVIIAVISNLTKNRKKKAEKKNTWRPGGQQAQAQPRQAQAQPHRPAAQQTTMGEDIFPRAAQVHCQTCEAGRQAYPPRRGPKRRRQPGRTLYRRPIHPGQHGCQLHRRHGNGGGYCFRRRGRHGRQPGRAPAQAPGQPA